MISRPRDNTPSFADAPSAMTCPFVTFCPLDTIGLWLIQFPVIPAGRCFSRSYTSMPPSSAAISIFSEVTRLTTPSLLAATTSLESRAILLSAPDCTRGCSAKSSDTACRCMLAPIRALLGSSCSRSGISDVDGPKVCCLNASA